MPIYSSDYHSPASGLLNQSSASFYYSPYSFKSRMTSALGSCPTSLFPSVSSSTMNGLNSISKTSLAGYPYSTVVPRPISIDTSTIDITTPRIASRPRVPLARGDIRRGRTVVRLKTVKPKENPALGKKLAEKFTIPERPSTGTSTVAKQHEQQAVAEVKTANAGAIRRRVSNNRRKSSLIGDDGVAIGSGSRKCSLSEQLLREEEAIFDHLIREEMSRHDLRRRSEVTYEEVKKRSSLNRGKAPGGGDGELLRPSSSSGSPASKKRYSVDLADMKRYSSTESDDLTLADFLKSFGKKNHDQAPSKDRSPSPPPPKSQCNQKQPKISIKAEVSIDTTVANKNGYDVIIEESPERSPSDASVFTFVIRKNQKQQQPPDQSAGKLADKSAGKSEDATNIVGDGEKNPVKKVATTATKSASPKKVLTKKLKSNIAASATYNADQAEKIGKTSKSIVGDSTKKKKKPTNKVKPVAKDRNNNVLNGDISMKENSTCPAIVADINQNLDNTSGAIGSDKSNDGVSSTESARKKREINWKMVEVGHADFDDEIIETNGWIPDSEDSCSSSEESSGSDDDCDVNCHRKCEKLMPNLCGVNQKLIVEALSALKKDSSGTSSSSASSCSPTRNASSHLSVDSMTIDESSNAIRRKPYSYLHRIRHQHEGPITYPATTIPRFKKYTIHDFNFLKVLGKGSFGKVLLAELKGTEYYYAVKCLKKDVVLEDDDVECTLIERKVLTLGSKHPYLCHLFCTFQTQSHLFFVMEYLNGGDLMFHIQQSGRFDEGRARFYAAEIVSGLRFLHKKGIVYRDLKLDNILLDFEGHIRIADFGMCKLQIYLDRTADTFCGTPDYMAPEIIKGLKYNQSVDWWSFGILLYEMVIGQSPFSGCDEDQLFWSVCNEQPQYPRYLSAQVKSLLIALLEKDASKRIGSLGCNSGDDIMEHAFFSGMDWNRLERKELEPPYKPRVFHPLDTHYFDQHFTRERPRLTPVDKTILESMDQTQFQGFTYTNPNVTDF